MIVDVILRGLIVAVCLGVIVTSLNVASWALSPIWRWVLKDEDRLPVMVEPVGLIEGDKVRQVESRVLAGRLRHRVSEIRDILNDRQADDLNQLQQSKIDLLMIGRTDNLEITTSSPLRLDFEAKVFSFDVTGLANFLAARLDRHDSVRAMIELESPTSRLYLEIDHIAGGGTRLVEDGPGTLTEALDHTACAIMLGYLAEDPRFDGLTTAQFCQYVSALGRYRRFVRIAAAQSRSGQDVDLGGLREVAQAFETGQLAHSQAPAIDLILAALYRLENRRDEALARLERAARGVHDDPFVAANLTAWRDEAETRASRVAALSALQRTRTHPPSVSITEEDPLARIYDQIRDQTALEAINYLAMLDRLTGLPAQPVRIGVMTTGFTPPATLPDRPEILPVRNTSDDPDGEDGNGFGNMTTHLLAALLPRENVSILPLKVLPESGVGRPDQIVLGVDEAAKARVDILATPLGMSGTATDLAAAFEKLDAIRLAAAGNTARRQQGETGTVSAPANFPRVVSVGSLTGDGAIASYSPGPEGVDLFLPGEVRTTLTGEELRDQRGTSFSLVLATALFAAARSVDPGLSQDDILRHLQGTARDAGPDLPRIVDALAFIEAVAR